MCLFPITTIISEHQVREHGLVIDSVAKKHMLTATQHGAQSFHLNEDVHVPFVDKGGSMGMEILDISEDDTDEHDPKLDTLRSQVHNAGFPKGSGQMQSLKLRKSKSQQLGCCLKTNSPL